MESQDGISVRPMRLKVLYTFDDANKTNCLARWPNLLEIQTAFLDEKTQIGVIELKTCIQAIVSASPELVANLGQDYTVYAYDYSEYETPLVGQGMLSWVLSSSTPTPNAHDSQSKTMITGRVCKNVLGLFSKGAQETLEVKLRLVPVPTASQSEYFDSMQRYRELSNIIPHGFDPQTWTNYIRQNPDILAGLRTQQPDRTVSSPMDHAGIERFHQILSEGSTPRDFPAMTPTESFRPLSPAQSSASFVPPSRHSTPGGQHSSQRQSLQQQSQPQSQQLESENRSSQHDMIRPSSSASMHDSEFPTQMSFAGRRGSVHSGYGGGEESEPHQRKRARVYQTGQPGKADFNIEKQPSSLRVAASTAASVRIHRPTPLNPSSGIVESSIEEPIRPPTPISGPNDLPRRIRPLTSSLRESFQPSTRYTSPYPPSDDQPSGDQNAHSPEEPRYHGLFEPSFSMPSSPPVLDGGIPTRSSPNLPHLATDPDSGFMSGGIDELLDDDLGTPLDDCTAGLSNDTTRNKQTVRPAISANSPASAPTIPGRNRSDSFLMSEGPSEQHFKESAPPLPRAPASASGSRPSSRASTRPGPKPLAPAPISQSELEQLMNAVPASDPIPPPPPPPAQPAHSCTGPMSDISAAETPAPIVIPDDDGKVRSKTGARRSKQIHDRLDQCIRSGQAPPYCGNCGAIETPTWRRAWFKEVVGSEEDANDCKTADTTVLFWKALDRDDEEKVTKFQICKKTLLDNDKDFDQVSLCNPCGLWLQKFKSMRPEHKWNNKTQNANSSKRKRSQRRTGPLSNMNATTRIQPLSAKPATSSPGGTDASSPAEEGPTPRTEHDKDDNESQNLPSKRRRANSLEHRKDQDPMEALRRAIQSSPVRNAPLTSENSLTPKPVRRNLFPSQNEGPLKALGESTVNSPRRSPRIASRESDKRPQDKENHVPGVHGDLDCLFEGPGFELEFPASPTPKRRNARSGEKRLALPYNSPTSRRKNVDSDLSPTKLTAQKLQRIQNSPSRQSKSLKQPRSDGHAFPSLPGNSLDNIADIFEDGTNGDSSFMFDPSKSDWADWMPSDYVSPVGSDAEQPNGGDQDLINLILSDPNFQNENNPFSDSSLFGSDFLGLGVKTNDDKENHASSNDASASA